MQILPNGQVQIKNNDTGETKVVNPSELGNYSPYLVDQYTAQNQAKTSNIQTGIAGLQAAGESAHLPAITADTEVAQNAAKQLKFMADTASKFEKAKGSDNFVSPQDYNQAKNDAAGLKILEPAFDEVFNRYTNPKNIFYNTPEGRDAQNALATTRRQIHAQLDAFNNIPADQKGVFSKSISEINPSLAQLIAPQAAAYENNRAGLSAQLSTLAGGGQGTGLKISQAELNRWASLLPSTRNSAAGNEANKKQLDALIKAKFNIDQGLDPAYLSSKGRPPLKNFER